MNAITKRQHYVSDQGMRIARLPLLVLGGLFAAVAVGWLLQSLFFLGWYLVILVPLLGAALLAGVLRFLIGWTHCRNRWVAGTLGAVVGLLAYLSYFYFCMIHQAPPGVARLSLLPSYIVFRMQNDVQEEIGKPKNINRAPRKPFAGLNWYVFVFESLFIVGIITAASWNRARRAYCFEREDWMQQEMALVPPYAGPAVIAALASEEQLTQFAVATAAGGDAQTACRLILEYVQPMGGSALSYPIYLSIEDLPNPKPRLWPGNLRRTLLRQTLLSLPDVIALRSLFPKLTEHLAEKHSELRDLPLRPVSEDIAATSGGAMITHVPDSYRQRIRSPGYAVKVNLIGLTPMMFLGAGIGSLALGGYFLSHENYLLGLVPLLLGAASAAWGVYVTQCCMYVYENRWIERRLRREIAGRPDALVSPRDPEAIYVSLIPRESFAKVRLTMSSDLLLLGCDQSNGELLLEGDSDRYRIPADSIEACEPQCFFHPADAHRQNELWMARLMIKTQQGKRELLLSPSHTNFRPRKNIGRRHAAEELCQRILALRT